MLIAPAGYREPAKPALRRLHGLEVREQGAGGTELLEFALRRCGKRVADYVVPVF